MRRNAFIGMALAAVSMMGIGSLASLYPSPERSALVPHMPTVSKPSKRIRKTTRYPRNGKREVARRLRQIAAGQLTRSNGLVTREELYGRKAA